MNLLTLPLLLTAALTVVECRSPDNTLRHEGEETVMSTGVRLSLTYPDAARPRLVCQPLYAADQSVVAGSVVTGVVARLQEQFGLMVRLDYKNGQLRSCRLVPAFTRSEDLNPSWCMLPPTATTAFVCPPGWHLIESTCFMLTNYSGTWFEGQEFCNSEGGTLATVSSDVQQAELMLMLIGDTWIGLTDLKEEHSYVWVDGSSNNYTSWASGEPSNSGAFWVFGKRESCIEMMQKSFYLWNDAHCDDNKQFLCSVPADPAPTTPTTTSTTTTTTTTTPAPTCGIWWETYKLSCYIILETAMSWRDAQASCNSVGASLASVTSEGERRFLTGLLGKSSWIGLSDLDGDRAFTWEDRSPLRFTSWHYGEPSSSFGFFGGSENCVEMRKNFGYLWNNEYCSTKNGYICERPIQ